MRIINVSFLFQAGFQLICEIAETGACLENKVSEPRVDLKSADMVRLHVNNNNFATSEINLEGLMILMKRRLQIMHITLLL